MKKTSLLRWGARNALGLFLAALASSHPASAQDVNKTSILQNKADEQDIRLHTTAVVTQVQSLIDELAANGISGDDSKVLQTTKAVLSNLSTKEMERVISSLQAAGEASGTKAGQRNVVDAYAGQKGIVLQFRQILKEYDERQAAYELPERFKELTDQQTETMRMTAKVAQTAAGKGASELSTMDQTTEQIVQSDQDSLTNEVALAQQQLDKAAQGSTGDEGKAMQQAQQDLKGGGLQEALNQANNDLKAGKLLQALNEQKIARDELRTVTKDLNPQTNAVDALAAAAASLAKLIEEQKSLLDQTNAAIGVKPPVAGLDEKQGALVDETNLLQGDMQSLGSANADLVKAAIDPMQTARSEMGPRRPAFDQAAGNEQDAIAKLEAAQKSLQQQLADAQKAADDANKDPLQKLQDMQQQIQQAMQQQQQITQQTAQAAAQANQNATAQAQQAQNQLQQQVAAMQQAAQPLDLQASQALANAAQQMNQAGQDMANQANQANTAQAQQAAQAALAQANQQVAQQIAQAQQQAADPAALAAAANQLQAAQNDVGTAMADATPDAGAPAAGAAAAPPTMAEAGAALAAAAQATAAAAATPGLPDAAAAAVKDAQGEIAQGQQAAAQGNAQATAADAAAAQGSLAQAQAAVAVAQAGMTASGPAMAGGPPDSGPPGPGAGPPTPDDDGAKAVSAGSAEGGALHDVTGSGKFVTVAFRDRAAIDQTQTENRPQEYAPMIDQYMKNLADQSSASTQ